MHRSPQLSFITTNYNQPQNLRFIMAACARQSFTDFELIVADDGSGPAVEEVVAEGRSQYNFPIVHVWHEDGGWRKNAILNKAILASRADYIVFSDGDCIPSMHFLLDHWNEREAKRVLLGRRVETSERWSKSLTVEKIRSGAFERYGWELLVDGLKGNALRLEDGLRIPSRLLRKVLLRDVSGMLGSNFSIAKDDLIAVNGFDELYTGPGCGEDSDIQYRLSLIGVTGKSMRNLAVQFHLWHPLTRVSDENKRRFEMTKEARRPRCSHGLERLPTS